MSHAQVPFADDLIGDLKRLTPETNVKKFQNSDENKNRDVESVTSPELRRLRRPRANTLATTTLQASMMPNETDDDEGIAFDYSNPAKCAQPMTNGRLCQADADWPAIEDNTNTHKYSTHHLEPITEAQSTDQKAGDRDRDSTSCNQMPKKSLTRHASLMLDGTATKLHFRGRPPSPRRFSVADAADNFRHSIREKSAGWMRNRLQNSRRIRNRLMQKNGVCNIQLVNVPKQGWKYFSDLFTTVIELKWRWCLGLFALSYFLSWLSFALIFYICVLAHGDLQHLGDINWQPCIQNVQGFLTVLMFSVESQSTIGYGFRYPTDECPVLVTVVCLQNMVGVMTQTMMTGVVFAKLARPKKRAETIMFSKNAVMCMRDGRMCFFFRLGDMRQSQLAEAHIRLQMIKKLVTREGELQPFHQFDMDVGYDEGLDRVFVIWPITICHVIDEDSPLYDVPKADLLNGTARFEIIAILEGVVESTGATTQARTSYLPNEILWGHRFQKLVTYQRENGEYRIDFGLFHSTYPTQTPEYSGKQLDEMRDRGLDPERMFAEACQRNFLSANSVTGGQSPASHKHNGRVRITSGPRSAEDDNEHLLDDHDSPDQHNEGDLENGSLMLDLGQENEDFISRDSINTFRPDGAVNDSPHIRINHVAISPSTESSSSPIADGVGGSPPPKEHLRRSSEPLTGTGDDQINDTVLTVPDNYPVGTSYSSPSAEHRIIVTPPPSNQQRPALLGVNQTPRDSNVPSNRSSPEMRNANLMDSFGGQRPKMARGMSSGGGGGGFLVVKKKSGEQPQSQMVDRKESRRYLKAHDIM